MADMVCEACGEATNVLLPQCTMCDAALPSDHDKVELLVAHVQALGTQIEQLQDQLLAFEAYQTMLDQRATILEHEQHQLQRSRAAFEAEKQQWHYERKDEEPPIRRIEKTQFTSTCILSEGPTYEISIGTIENKVVVQKMLRDSIKCSEFAQMANFLSLLKSDYIVTMLGTTSWKAELGPAIYLEHMELRDLRSYLDATPRSQLSWETKFQIALAVAQALSYLHKMDLHHGALTLDHILLNSKKQAKVTGFHPIPSTENRDGQAADITAFGQFLLELASHGYKDLDAYDSPEWYQAILEHCVVDVEQESDEVQPSAVDLVSVFQMYPSIKLANQTGPTTSLTVTVHRAQGLTNPLVFGAPQRSCRLRVGGQVLQTKVQPQAYWNESCTFDAVDPLLMELEIDILNAMDERLGKCNVAFIDVLNLSRPSQELWLQVYTQGKPCGELFVTLEFQNTNLKDQYEDFQLYLKQHGLGLPKLLKTFLLTRASMDRVRQRLSTSLPGVVSTSAMATTLCSIAGCVFLKLLSVFGMVETRANTVDTSQIVEWIAIAVGLDIIVLVGGAFALLLLLSMPQRLPASSPSFLLCALLQGLRMEVIFLGIVFTIMSFVWHLLFAYYVAIEGVQNLVLLSFVQGIALMYVFGFSSSYPLLFQEIKDPIEILEKTYTSVATQGVQYAVIAYSFLSLWTWRFSWHAIVSTCALFVVLTITFWTFSLLFGRLGYSSSSIKSQWAALEHPVVATNPFPTTPLARAREPYRIALQQVQVDFLKTRMEKIKNPRSYKSIKMWESYLASMDLLTASKDNPTLFYSSEQVWLTTFQVSTAVFDQLTVQLNAIAEWKVVTPNKALSLPAKVSSWVALIQTTCSGEVVPTTLLSSPPVALPHWQENALNILLSLTFLPLKEFLNHIEAIGNIVSSSYAKDKQGYTQLSVPALISSLLTSHIAIDQFRLAKHPAIGELSTALSDTVKRITTTFAKQEADILKYLNKDQVKALKERSLLSK
ncbi:hypothetical protein THRCLA_07727 [Thraustotheca clavata]|uniref:Uncharacterized protein n=1 Tax=Thraustotheca clavata TaxID=74557 RepID=A0A1V9ZC84_9STRA|nr:hypothetical protein THRCLA_07727 [Thraustotheca clavata]